MCGLFASIGFAADPSHIDIVAHRGPDGRGWQEFESQGAPVALGHRRLAIIDVSDAGLQPFADPSGRFHVVFNGEIYNYIELRDELRRTGSTFGTESDTEVLLNAYAVWGEGCLARLRGMFAFAIWDARNGRLFAARDRFGIKPLYMLANGTGVAFASEIKQLLRLPGVSGRINVARVHDFLASGMSDHTAETMFDGVGQIRGGECVTVETAQGRVGAPQVRRWYAAVAGASQLSENEAADQFRALLADAVRLHLRSDVPVGSCLSGGLDSSAIVCLMSGLMGSTAARPSVHTVSACYEDKSVDEKPFMDAVVEHAHTQPHFVFPRADDVFQRASDITWHQDEPFGSTSIFAQWCVFEEARRAGIKVMLDGQGADEQLAGYHGAFPYRLAALTRQGRLHEVLRTLSDRKRLHHLRIRDQLPAYAAQMLPRGMTAALRSLYQHRTKHGWLATSLVESRGNPEGALALAGRLLDLEPATDLRSLCLVMTFASNLPMLLHWEDRNSMAHSIEARVPFLDHPLVEFCLALGNDHKVVGGDTKRVLRRGLADVLPKAVTERRDKLGFATPEQSWFRGPLKGAIVDGVERALARFPGLMNADGVRAMASAMLDGRQTLDFTLWRIVSLGLWGERFGLSGY